MAETKSNTTAVEPDFPFPKNNPNDGHPWHYVEGDRCEWVICCDGKVTDRGFTDQGIAVRIARARNEYDRVLRGRPALGTLANPMKDRSPRSTISYVTEAADLVAEASEVSGKTPGELLDGIACALTLRRLE